MKSDDTEIRHIKGRTVKVERFEQLTPSDKENEEHEKAIEDWNKETSAYTFLRYPSRSSTEHRSTYWTTSVLSLNGWTKLFGARRIDPEHTTDYYDFYFDEAGAVL